MRKFYKFFKKDIEEAIDLYFKPITLLIEFYKKEWRK